MRDMQNMAAPQQQMGQPQDMNRVFQAEKESLDLTVHKWDLLDVEARVLDRLRGSTSKIALKKHQ